MRKFFFNLILCVLPTIGFAQKITCSALDRTKVIEKIHELEGLGTSTTISGEGLVTIGKTFLGTPYVAKTLEVGSKESLVVNLSGLDCTTFVENVLAFQLLLKHEEKTFDAFLDNLELIRYYKGMLQGYPSRLHYFTQWVRDNERKGLVKNITETLGGKYIEKDINFMTTHRDLYPFLADDVNYKKLQIREEQLNSQLMCVLAPEDLLANERLLQSGDIIALATSIKGLDVTHTGIVTREANGRIHLLHASSSGQVEISKLPLVDYLKKIKHNIGITVARPL